MFARALYIFLSIVFSSFAWSSNCVVDFEERSKKLQDYSLDSEDLLELREDLEAPGCYYLKARLDSFVILKNGSYFNELRFDALLRDLGVASNEFLFGSVYSIRALDILADIQYSNDDIEWVVTRNAISNLIDYELQFENAKLTFPDLQFLKKLNDIKMKGEGFEDELQLWIDENQEVWRLIYQYP